MRNLTKYPHIVLLDSSGHYPERYIQVTLEEFNDLKKNQLEYHGCFGCCKNLEYIYSEERQIDIDEVDQLPKSIPCYCEYE